MKTRISILFALLISVPALAQLQTFKGDTTAAPQANRINFGASSDGRAGQKSSTGNFRKFAFLEEVIAATSGGISSINGKTGTAVTLVTTDIAEGVNQYYTNARARSALSATGPIVYTASTGAFTFSGTPADVQLGNVNNTSDASKPVSGPQQNALDLKQNVASAIYRDNVASYSALTAYTVPAGQTYLIRVASDESQVSPYNVNQWYLKDGTTGATFKLALIKQ